MPEIILTSLLGVATAWTHGDWLLFNIYASAMAASLPTRRNAIIVVFLLQCGLLAFTQLLHLALIDTAIGILLSVVSYIGTWMQWELGRRNQQLQEAQSEIRALAAIAERERIARDMHDLLGHSLTVIAVKAELAERMFSLKPEQTRESIAEIAKIARTALQDVRQAVSGMNGASLRGALTPIKTALNAAGIALTVEGEDNLRNETRNSILAMALREAVTNIIRHSSARNCHISFTCDEAGHARILTVSDDGQSTVPCLVEGNGLRGMRTRMQAAGGSLSITQTSSGLTLKASLSP